jgi:cell division protein FtsB
MQQQRRAPGGPARDRSANGRQAPRQQDRLASARRPVGAPAGRRPAAGAAATSPGGVARVASRTRAPEPRRFTGRATVLVLVLGSLLLAYAYPVRIYLGQQARIASLEAHQAAQRQRIVSLGQDVKKWDDPEYIRTQARSRLQMVKPGEVAYIIDDPTATPPPDGNPDAGRAKDTGPWYTQLWSSVQAADKPRGP